VARLDWLMIHLQYPESEGVQKGPDVGIISIELVNQFGEPFDRIEWNFGRYNHCYFQYQTIVFFNRGMVTVTYMLFLYFLHFLLQYSTKLLAKHFFKHFGNSRSFKEILASMNCNIEIGIE
jgi:hypothetical protein